MRGVKKEVHMPRSKRKDYRLFDLKQIDSSLQKNGFPLTSTQMSDQFGYANGTLMRAHTFCALDAYRADGVRTHPPACPEGAKQFFVFVQNDAENVRVFLICIGRDNQFYTCEAGVEDAWTRHTGLQLYDTVAGVPYCLNGKDVFLLNDRMRLAYFDGKTIQHLEWLIEIECLYAYGARLFATRRDDPYSISFSSANDPEDWRASEMFDGKIKVGREDGKVLKITGLLNAVYVIREYGITKINILSGEQFQPARVFSTKEKILAGSIEEDGGMIVFATASGIFGFDGYRVNTLGDSAKNVFERLQPSTQASTAFAGKYYLACRLSAANDALFDFEKTESAEANNCFLCLDLKSGQISLSRAVSICALFSCENARLRGVLYLKKCGEKEALGQLNGVEAEEMPPCIWSSPEVLFDDSAREICLHEMGFFSNGAFRLIIEADGRRSEFFVSGGHNVIRPAIKASRFRFAIISQEPAPRIEAGRVWVEYLEGV